MLVDDLYNRLRAALPESVPILRPEQLTMPGDWYETDADGVPLERGEHGLHVYLREQAPGGYVQLYDSGMGFSTGKGGWADNQPLQIDTVADRRADALALANRVRDLLAASPRRGGNRHTTSPPFVSSADSVSVRVTQRFNVRSAFVKGRNL